MIKYYVIAKQTMYSKIAYYILIYFLLFTLLVSCDSHKHNVLVIDPRKFSNEKFTLSTIADEVSYIPLDNKVPIGLYYTFAYNKSGFIISTKESGLLHFDCEGKFIKVLAPKGQGPDEYHYGMIFTMDEKNKNIYLADRSAVKVYQLNGRHIRTFSTKDFFVGSAKDIKIFNSSVFMADYGESSTFKYNWVITDTLGKSL